MIVSTLSRRRWSRYLALSVGLACALRLAPLQAGEALPDPWASWDAHQAIILLASLRAPLDAQPDDQHLLGLAIMAYVNLSLGCSREEFGRCGPWPAYARELAQRRRAARQDAPIATLAEAAPELWLALLEGDARGVEQALARWPEQRASPLARALQVVATRDWRVLKDARGLTAHERFAQIYASVSCGHGAVDWQEAASPGADPFILATGQRMANQGEGESPSTVLLTDTAWMLRSRELDDAQAMTLADGVLEAIGVASDKPAGKQDDRALRLAAIASAAEHAQGDDPRVLGAAWRAATACLDKPRGIRDASGHHLLVGLGDVASWQRDRLYLATALAYGSARYYNEFAKTDRSFTSVLRRLVPDAAITARCAIGNQHERFQDPASPEHLQALATAMQGERARRGGLSDTSMLLLATKLMYRGAQVLEPQLDELLRQPTRCALDHAYQLAQQTGRDQALAPLIASAATRDPWDLEMASWAAQWSTSTPLLDLSGQTPTQTWVDPIIDVATDHEQPWPHTDHKQPFAIIWEGSLRIDVAGEYLLGITSDDGSRLSVDGRVVASNPGRHAMIRRVGRLKLEPGSHPLRVEFYQAYWGAGCRLEWQPPGGDGWSTVPAERLQHAAPAQPGLSAQFFALDERSLARAELIAKSRLARAEAMPWQLDEQRDIGTKLALGGMMAEAEPFFRNATAANSARWTDWIYLGCSLLAKEPPEVAGALAVFQVGSSRVDLQACKLEYSIVSPK